MLNLRKSRGQYVHDSALLRAGQGEPRLLLFSLSRIPGRFFEKAMAGFFPGVFSSDVLLRPLKTSSAMPCIEFFRRQNMRTVGGVLFQRESISIRPTEKRFVSTYGFTKLRQRRVKPGTCYRQGNVFGACMTLRDCKRRGWGELAAVVSSVRSAVRKAPEKEMCTCLALMPAHDGQPLA